MQGISLVFFALFPLRSALNVDEKRIIVEKHNWYRSQRDPLASDMKKLSWDSTLETLAKSYAAKCIWDHNIERGFRGENLFVMTGPSFDVELGLIDWYQELDDYDFTNNTCTEGKMCGHYTQMVWASTERIGCGYHLCETMEGYEETNVHFLVCNYEPPGNFQGRKPYRVGVPCSECQSDDICGDSLCVHTRNRHPSAVTKLVAGKLPGRVTEVPGGEIRTVTGEMGTTREGARGEETKDPVKVTVGVSIETQERPASPPINLFSTILSYFWPRHF